MLDVSRSPLVRPVFVLAILAGGAFPAAAQEGVDGDLEQRVAELERLLREERQAAVEPDPDPLAARKEATHTTRPGFWTVPGTDFAFKIGGYVKLDVIHDSQAIGNAFKFATQTISVPEESQPRTTIHARETRLNFDLRGQVEGHDVRTFVEVDFFGSGGALNLRHAYGEVGGLLAGQTWTTYMDLSSRPHTLDFEGPDGELFVRNPMVRWTQPVEGFGSWSVAIEDTSQDVSTDPAFSGSVVTPLPDLTGNVRMEGDGCHAQFSGVLRQLNFEGDPGTPDEDTLGWGLALSGKTEVGAAGRRLMGQVSFGEGCAFYNQALRGAGSDAFLNASGSFDALPVTTLVVGYEQDWNPRWTSTFAYSRAAVDNEAGQAATALHDTQSASANLVWHPFDHFLTGLEYLFGTRENNDGISGYAHRLQFSFKFLF